jgi:dihydrofolate reductase
MRKIFAFLMVTMDGYGLERTSLLGSSALTASLVRLRLLDGLRIMVNPVALGNGRPVLRGGDLTRYRLLRTRAFDSGNVLLCYQPQSVQA